MKKRISIVLLVIVFINFLMSFFVPSDFYYDCVRGRIAGVDLESWDRRATVYASNKIAKELILEKYPAVSVKIPYDKSAYLNGDSEKLDHYLWLDVDRVFLFRRVRTTDHNTTGDYMYRGNYYLNIGTVPIYLFCTVCLET